MRLAEFDFDLPLDRIAERPVTPRDSARLLVVRGGASADRHVRDLPNLLRPGDLLVFNDTRVVPARLRGRRGATDVELTLLRCLDEARWTALARPAKRLRPGDEVMVAEEFSAVVEGRAEGEVRLRFNLGGSSLRRAMARHGEMPLPPYVARRRPVDARDREDYQTVFARHEGAVAAPTAGLHFTAPLIRTLSAAGIGHAFVTLHVGGGTFLPVRTDDVAAHRLHPEWGEIKRSTVNLVHRARTAGGRIIAVGTTCLRLLEAAAATTGNVGPFVGDTDLFITPGYRFLTADLLLTNFHLPRSTLFMLVCAFAGTDTMHSAYAHAKRAGYRFYSYGDACLLRRAAL